MNHRWIRWIWIIAVLLFVPLLANAEGMLFQEGYVRVQGDTPVYIDTSFREAMGVIQDASVVYVTEIDPDTGVYSIAFGVDWVVRIGYIDGQSVFPLSAIEQEMYLNLAKDGLMIRDIYLLNVGFAIEAEDDETGEAGVTALPTTAPTPLPTVMPLWSSSSSGNAINVIMQPADQVGFNGEMVVLAVGAENVREYQWQYFKNGQWIDSVMSQARDAAMKLVVYPSSEARIYRCKMTGIYGDVVYSNVVTIAEQ